MGLLGLVASPAAQAQCVGCDGQMVGAALANQAAGAINDVNRLQREQEQRALLGNAPAPATGTTVSDPPILDRIIDTQMARLAPEYSRRAAASGKTSAGAWLTAASRELGRQTGELAPEYRRRIAAQGQAEADAWYLATADELSRRYVQDNR